MHFRTPICPDVVGTYLGAQLKVEGSSMVALDGYFGLGILKRCEEECENQEKEKKEHKETKSRKKRPNEGRIK